MATDSFRVLSVDDFAPWCQYVRSTLQKQRQPQVIGEVSDGLEAVQKAQELQPDLILLDIGLRQHRGRWHRSAALASGPV